MNIAIDIGNTRTKIGIFDKQEMRSLITYDNSKKIAFEEIFATHNISKSIISSTVEIPNYIIQKLASLPQHLILNETTRLPFHNCYSSKETLGKDRLALVAAATAMFPNQNTLVIGCGTCITFNFINAQNEFLGGSIHPGLKMRLKAMHTFTGKLPLAALISDADLMANNTEANLQSGVLYGASKEIDGMISDYLVKFSEMNTIITGGDSDLLVYRLKNQIFAISNFTLIGLNHILEYNA
ncbi:MAG TPA: type III pantothenate kinase [Chitinophagales bacterium]|nr:type III pantothenate kinase [Chitinophagales bacterium]HNA39659.1 type III pantothenate kinase [Chitinophagales bacterium]HND82631.1 type III pantothenate kinase [Chitinophagales bacterium]HNF19252.1 type III pantothenate kinase [Chitinophagales bacterium]HNK11642.1 type III pantothenate kinase [Chitinophagales bacterium]